MSKILDYILIGAICVLAGYFVGAVLGTARGERRMKAWQDAYYHAHPLCFEYVNLQGRIAVTSVTCGTVEVPVPQSWDTLVAPGPSRRE